MSTALSLIKAIEKHPELKSAETERDALKMLKRLKVMKKAPERKKKNTWNCNACGKEYGELDPVSPTHYTLCPDCV